MNNTGQPSTGSIQHGGAFSHKAPVLSTDMRCYFGCKEAFKKDVDLRLHLKLRHRNEDEGELRRAFQDAEEEIALTSSSASTYQCALCPKKFSNHNTFWAHITKRIHNMPWPDYKEKYGSCEVESSPFECKICGRVIKYIRDSITKHLRMVHQITWPLYVDRIRKMRSGQRPDKLPNIDFFECKICNSSVKYCSRGSHLQGVHKITEPEYLELFQDNDERNNNIQCKSDDSSTHIIQQSNWSGNEHSSTSNKSSNLPYEAENALLASQSNTYDDNFHKNEILSNPTENFVANANNSFSAFPTSSAYTQNTSHNVHNKIDELDDSLEEEEGDEDNIIV